MFCVYNLLLFPQVKKTINAALNFEPSLGLQSANWDKKEKAWVQVSWHATASVNEANTPKNMLRFLFVSNNFVMEQWFSRLSLNQI